nr:1-acyl-sn-glycerol-3-phosphate acyltransferase [Bacteroidales bacterium]
MSKIHGRHRGYKELRHYVDMCTRSCHREVRYEGLENIPEDSAVLLSPNHCAALMDAMVILATPVKGGVICFGARSDIFRKPAVARILRWLRIVPLARERNGLSEVAKNFEVFDEIIECLGSHVPFCMFSEGTHRAMRGMLPIKKGIFRLARMAIEKTGQPVYIVPAGIDYEDFYHGQHRVTVRYGKPIDVGAEFAAGLASGLTEAETYRQLAYKLRSSNLALLGLDPEEEPLPDAKTFSARDAWRARREARRDARAAA